MKNKITKLWNNANNASFTIAKQTNIKDDLSKSIRKVNVIKNVYSTGTILETEYIPLTKTHFTEQDGYVEAYVEFKIEVGQIPEAWIDQIKPIFIYDYQNGSLSESAVLKQNNVISIKSVEGSTLKNVIINSGVVIRDYDGVQDNIYVKLSVKLSSPQVII